MACYMFRCGSFQQSVFDLEPEKIAIRPITLKCRGKRKKG